jgi:hypothetical protein
VILQCGKFPSVWNHSLISSIYKSGDPNDCNNYRGISVTSCLGKYGSLCEFPNLQEYIVFEYIFVIKSKNFPPMHFFNNS